MALGSRAVAALGLETSFTHMEWFRKSDDFDAEIRRRFGETHAQAAAGRLDEWASDAQGALALYVVLIGFYAWYMNKLDQEYGVSEGDE